MIKALEEAARRTGQRTPPRASRSAADKDDKDAGRAGERLQARRACDIRSPEKVEAAREGHPPVRPARSGPARRAGAQAQLAEARRRAAQRRAADGQGLRRHQAGDLGRRQDGRPARQQGRHLQGPARGGHAVPGRRHAGGHPAQPAGRAEPHERRPDSRDAPGLGRGQARVPGDQPGLRRGQRGGDPPVPEGSRPPRDRQGRSCTTAAPATRSSSR